MPNIKDFFRGLPKNKERKLIHDIRSALLPAFVSAERLKNAPDEKTTQQAQKILDSLQKALDLMEH
jgi:hypothetical protein